MLLFVSGVGLADGSPCATVCCFKCRSVMRVLPCALQFRSTEVLTNDQRGLVTVPERTGGDRKTAKLLQVTSPWVSLLCQMCLLTGHVLVPAAW